jgi:hypothetical protein
MMLVLPNRHMLQSSAGKQLHTKQQADDDQEYGAAEQKAQQFLASVAGHKQHQQPAHHVARPKPVPRPPPPPVTQTKSFKPFGGSDNVLRGKVTSV